MLPPTINREFVIHTTKYDELFNEFMLYLGSLFTNNQYSTGIVHPLHKTLSIPYYMIELIHGPSLMIAAHYSGDTE